MKVSKVEFLRDQQNNPAMVVTCYDSNEYDIEVINEIIDTYEGFTSQQRHVPNDGDEPYVTYNFILNNRTNKG